MANPYKEAEEKKRLEAERRKQEEAAKKAAQEAQDEPEAQGVVTTPGTKEKAQETAPEPETEPVTNAPLKSDLLADLIPKKKPKLDTYGFYLDSDVHDELVKLAKANKTNKSKFLNALLRRVLFGE